MNWIKQVCVTGAAFMMIAYPCLAGQYELEQGGYAARIDIVSNYCDALIEKDEFKLAAFADHMKKISETSGSQDAEWAYRTVIDVEARSLAQASSNVIQAVCESYVSEMNDVMKDKSPIKLRAKK